MKVLIKRSLIGVVVMAVFAVLVFSYGYFKYNKLRPTASASRAEILVDASTLFHDFENNETLAGSKYLNKVIEVRGVVAAIDSSGGNIAILLSTGSAGYVNCSMYGPIENTSMKNDIKIKGKCAGYMLDVIMVDCVIQ